MAESDLRGELAELKRKLDDLEQSSRANFGQVATAIRRTRQQVTQNELTHSIRRLSPPVQVLDWNPRAGQPNSPSIEDSLLDRLRKGNAVADTLGNADTFYGIQNLLLDPTMENIYPPAATAAAEAIVARVQDGVPAWYVKDGGTSATETFGVEYLRDDPYDNPYSSAAVRMQIAATGAGTHYVELRSPDWYIVNFPVLPYLVGAVRVARLFINTDTNVTSRKLIVELYDQTAGVVRGSTTVDLDNVVPIDSQTQVVTSCLFGGESWESNSFRLRVRLELVTTGASGTAYFHIGEPQFILSYSPDPPPYTPMVASWHPVRLITYGQSDPAVVLEAGVKGDTDPRVVILNNGSIEFGTGSGAPDATIGRTAAGEMTVDRLRFSTADDASPTSTTHPFQVGPTSGSNIIMDGNEIMGRNNGVVSTIFMQNEGGAVSMNGAVLFSRHLTSTVDADQNDYNPTDLVHASVIRFNSFTAARTLTGLTATSTGHLILLVNDTGQNLVLAHQSASSVAANRFRCPNAANLTVRPRGAVFVEYVSSVWQVVGV